MDLGQSNLTDITESAISEDVDLQATAEDMAKRCHAAVGFSTSSLDLSADPSGRT